jgi:phage-related protein
MARIKRVPAAFWSTEAGNEPVREWLKAMSKDDRTTIGEDLALLKYGWPVGMPLCRHMKREGLSELRSKLSGNRLARILLIPFDGKLVLLHGFIKKTPRTPKNDIDLALQRKKTLE